MQGIVIAGTHSGCGKTTITLGILAALRKKGYRVQPFKAGPDFIDTGLHRLVTGIPSRNLDLWMCGTEYVRRSFQKHSSSADIAVVEGVMGMYDGNISTADLAAELGLPVLLVVDAYGMAESAGAVVHGFREFSKTENGSKGRAHPTPAFAGVIFNRVASERHYKRLKESIQDIPVLGYLPRDLEFKIPHRHLGLVVAEEIPMSIKDIEMLAEALLMHVDLDRIAGKKQGENIPEVKQMNPESRVNPGKVKIGIAYDKAFCFYYQDNLDLLRDAGAEIVPFSPLADKIVPEGVDGIYLGGGYPELHAAGLSANKSLMESVREFADRGLPVYGECGGFMYLTEGIYDFEGVFHPMAGVFPFQTRMMKKRMRLGYRETVLQADSLFGKKGTVLRGHEFHYSEINGSGQGSGVSDQQQRGRGTAELIYTVHDGSGNYLYDEGYKVKNTIGSYIHLHFGSNEGAAQSFVNQITPARKNTVAG